MPGILGDLIQVTDKQLYLGEELLNVYYFRVTSVTPLVSPYMQTIAEWFRDNIISEVKEIQNTGLNHATVEARNLSNNLDFYELLVNVTGVVPAPTAERSPSYLTAGFQLIRESLATRNGYKRFSGLYESAISGNTLTFGSAEVLAIQAALAADIVVGLLTLAEPVIVQRPIVPPVTSFVYSSIGSAVFRGMGTQNTRKPN